MSKILGPLLLSGAFLFSAGSVLAQDSQFSLGVKAVDSTSPYRGGYIYGARINSVKPHTAAARAHLRYGYFITRVNGRRVYSFDQFRDEIRNANGVVMIRYRDPHSGIFYNTARIKLDEEGVLSAPTPDGEDY
jgi:hypothetical protein